VLTGGAVVTGAIYVPATITGIYDWVVVLP